MKDQTRNLNPHKEAKFAQWFFHDDYADLGLGTMDFFDGLSLRDKKLCKEAVDEILEAKGRAKIK